MSRKPTSRLMFIGSIVGIAVCLLASFAWMKARQKPATTAQERMAKEMGIRVPEYVELGKIIDKAEAKHMITKAEWDRLMDFARMSDNKELQGFVLMTMYFLKDDPASRSIKTQYAMKYLNKGYDAGNLGATMLLRKIGDSRWKQYAEKGLRSENQYTRENYEHVFKELTGAS